MNRRIRSSIAATCMALCQASFFSQLWLFFSYQYSTLPKTSQPELGRIYQSSNHGSLVYLTGAEATRLSLLWVVFSLGFVLLGVMVSSGWVPKEVGRREYLVMAVAVISWFAVIAFGGPYVCGFARLDFNSRTALCAVVTPTTLLHPLDPSQKSRQIVPALPHETPEVLESDLLAWSSPIRFHAPAQKRTTPRTKPIASGGAPHEARHQRDRVPLIVFLPESSGVA